MDKETLLAQERKLTKSLIRGKARLAAVQVALLALNSAAQEENQVRQKVRALGRAAAPGRYLVAAPPEAA